MAHVLRYTQIFSTVKRLLESGEIGRLIHMDLIENVAYWHFAHSYVRGNWRREEDSSPMILAKSCHDLDLLRWFAGSACISLSSNGGLSVFALKAPPKARTTAAPAVPYPPAARTALCASTWKMKRPAFSAAMPAGPARC